MTLPAIDHRPRRQGDRDGYDSDIEKDHVTHRLREECPECDDPDPVLTGDGHPRYYVECGSCGHSTEPVSGPLKGEVLVKAVRRWNGQVSNSTDPNQPSE